MQKLRILHLEDLPTDAMLVQRELQRGKIDFEILVVDNKSDFVTSMHDFMPDIILSDHSLPTLDSREALRLLNQEKVNIPFILITATVSEEYAVEIMRMGAYDYVLKDRLQRLPNAVLNALDKARIEKESHNFLKKIIASEKLLKKTEALARIGSFYINIRKEVMTWSDELYTILGYTAGRTAPTMVNFLRRVHPQDLQHANTVMKRAKQEQNTNFLNMQLRLLMEDGSVKFIHTELMVERDDEKMPLRITGFHQDITQQKRTEEKFLKSEANLFTIFENTDTGYILFDADVKIISFNKPAQKFATEDFHKRLKEGEPGVDFFLNDKITKALGENFNCEISYAQENGTDRWYYLRYLPISNAAEKKLGWVMALSEFTERKRAEIQRDKIAADLFRQNKDLEQFAYIVSHNLRAPVANILGLSNALENNNLPMPLREEMQKGLSYSTAKLDDVIKDLNIVLQLKRDIEEKKVLVRFSEVVEDIKSSIKNLVEKEQVEITIDFSAVNEMLTLKSYIYSIFYNIISNSIKYKRADATPTIDIRSELASDKITLLFKDNGLGIDLKRKADQVFGLYKRFHTHIDGKGIGLFLIKTQVEALHGIIALESEVNIGTTILIEFEV